MKNIIYNKDRHVLVSGKGKTKKEAFAEAINQIANKVSAEETDLVFKIEPQSFEVGELKEINEKEHFLFFFFPRYRKSYEVKIDALLHLEYIAIENVDSQSIEKDDNEQLRKLVKGV